MFVLGMRLLLLFYGIVAFSPGREGLLRQRPRKSFTQLKAQQGELERLARSVAVQSNATATLVNLIALGDEHCRQNNNKGIGFGAGKSLPSSWERVPGCMADARICLQPHQVQVGKELVMDVEGVADSRVAHGLVALLCQGLRDSRVSDILALEPEKLASQLGLAALPPGRLNGLQNMVRVLQQQARRLSSAPSPPSLDAKSQSTLGPALFSDPRASEVAVLLSGGVDSSVALKLLQEQGLKVRAFYLKIWLEDEVAHLNQCPWEEDLVFATDTCKQLGVELETMSLQEEYWNGVVQYTLAEAKAGRTPNPDIMCNARVKFGVFLDRMGRHFSKVASGHYAQVGSLGEPAAQAAWEQVRRAGITFQPQPQGQGQGQGHGQGQAQAVLWRSPDDVKDQTYFLCNLRQEQLQRTAFPIGHLKKPQVREVAEKHLLPSRARRDSQGICFLGKLKFDDFISHYLGERRGEIRDYRTDRLLGEHRGLWYHTIGQRKGIGEQLVPGVVNVGPWFVAAKDAASNTVYITNDLTLIDRPRKEFTVDSLNWIMGMPTGLEPGGAGLNLDIRLRHGPSLARGRVYATSHGEDGLATSCRVVLEQRDKGLAPGQFTAFYAPLPLGSDSPLDLQGEGVCLGAGVIAETARDELEL